MKIDRLLAMTVLLLNRERVSAKELAERFEVSTKTIYRDMDTLSQSGIPVFAHQGTSGGFEIMEQYTISRQYLTFGEISSIVAAVKGMGTVLDDSTFASLNEKVKALLSKSDKQQSEQQGQRIIFDLNPWGQGPEARNKVNLLRQAIQELQKVEMNYINMNGMESERTVEPYALILKGNVWYMQAYCTLREQFRVFRLSRMLQVQALEQTYERRKPPSLDGYAWEADWSIQANTEVSLSFRAEVRYRVGDAFFPNQVAVLEDGSLRVKGLFLVDEWFYGMLLSYGDKVRVEYPASIAEEVVKRARQILDRYV